MQHAWPGLPVAKVPVVGDAAFRDLVACVEPVLVGGALAGKDVAGHSEAGHCLFHLVGQVDGCGAGLARIIQIDDLNVVELLEAGGGASNYH